MRICRTETSPRREAAPGLRYSVKYQASHCYRSCRTSAASDTVYVTVITVGYAVIIAPWNDHSTSAIIGEPDERTTIVPCDYCLNNSTYLLVISLLICTLKTNFLKEIHPLSELSLRPLHHLFNLLSWFVLKGDPETLFNVLGALRLGEADRIVPSNVSTILTVLRFIYL